MLIWIELRRIAWQKVDGQLLLLRFYELGNFFCYMGFSFIFDNNYFSARVIFLNLLQKFNMLFCFYCFCFQPKNHSSCGTDCRCNANCSSVASHFHDWRISFFCPCCPQHSSKPYCAFVLKIHYCLPPSSMSKNFWPDFFNPLFHFFFVSFFCLSLRFLRA